MYKQKLTCGKRSIALVLMLLMVFSCFSMMGSVSAAEGDTAAVNVTAIDKDIDGDIYDKDQVTFSATLRNGSDDVSNVEVVFVADGRVVDTVKVGNLAGLAAPVVSAANKYNAWFGTHKIKAYARVDGTIVGQLAIRIPVIDDIRSAPIVDAPATPADAPIVINQVYGGGGKTEVVVSNDFIELFNNTEEEISINGYKVTYASHRKSGGDDPSIPGSTYGEIKSFTINNATIPAYGSYLIKCHVEERAVDAKTFTVDKFDAEWDQYIDNSQYSVVLYDNEGKALDAVTALDTADLVENKGEGNPITGIGKNKSIRRIKFQDTNDNSNDFEIINYKKLDTSYIPRSTADGSWAAPSENYDAEALAQPATEPVTQNIDAFDNVTNNVSKGTDNKGYTGSGYVNYIGNTSPVFNVNVAETGQYEIKFRYNGENARGNSGKDTSSAKVNVNGTDYNFTLVRFGNTYNKTYWDSWRWTDPVTVNLNAGDNKVTFSLNGWDYNLDTFTVEKVQPKNITSFSFLKANNPELKGDIKCEIGNGKITATIPANMDLSKLVATFEANGTVTAKVVNGATQESGVSALNYTNGMTLYCGGVEYSVVLNKTNSTDLPYLFVEFDSKITDSQKDVLLNSTNVNDKETKVDCTVSLDATSAKLPDGITNGGKKMESFQDVGKSTIKLRGNSTVIDAEKKSYTIKLGKKNAAMDMPKHKTWVIVGCNDDKTMMRQYMGYQLAGYFSKTNGDWSVHQRFAQVWFDGEYLGTFMFGESIKVDSNRLAIEDNDETEVENEDGSVTAVNYLAEFKANPSYDNLSFLVEKDNRDTNDPLYINGGGYGWIVTSPEDQLLAGVEGAGTYKQWISNYLGDAIGSFSGNYEQYIDVDSFIDWYICYEMMKTIDAGTGYSSVYLYKDVTTHRDGTAGLNGGKLSCGPAWDFNPGSGNSNYDAAAGYNNNTDGFWVRSDSYFWNRLFNNGRVITTGRYAGQNKTFAQAVSARYHELYTDYLSDIRGNITTLENYLAPAMKDNYKRWDMLDTYTWPQPTIYHSFDAEVDAFKTWMNNRSNWLNGQYPG